MDMYIHCYDCIPHLEIIINLCIDGYVYTLLSPRLIKVGPILNMCDVSDVTGASSYAI